MRSQNQTCYMTVPWQHVPEAQLCLGLLSCYLGTSWATNPVAKCSTQSGQRGSPSGFLIPKKLHYSFFLGSQARNLKVLQTLPAPSSAVTNLPAHSAVPWKCHPNSPFPLSSPSLLSPQPLFQHKTPWPKNLQQLPQPAAASLVFLPFVGSGTSQIQLSLCS